MAKIVKSFFRNLAELLTSESGEMLSARRKSHMMQHKMYSRIARNASEE